MTVISQPHPLTELLHAMDVRSPLCAIRTEATAGVAYDGTDYKSFVMGYPYECINNVRTRQQVMKGLLGFLLK